jgi:hypothetical protein
MLSRPHSLASVCLLRRRKRKSYRRDTRADCLGKKKKITRLKVNLIKENGLTVKKRRLGF